MVLEISIVVSAAMPINVTDTPFDSVADDKKDSLSVAAVTSTVFFAIAQVITCGGLLLIFLLRRSTAKQVSIIMKSTLVNILIGALTDLAFRLPLIVIREKKLGKTNPNLCVVMTLVPDYFMIATLMCLPLLSVERLIRLESKRRLTSKQTHNLFGCMLVIVYSISMVVILLPTTNIFNGEVNTKCDKNLFYGYAFPYVYSALTVLSVVLTLIFSIVVILRLKVKLRHLSTTLKRTIVLKQGTISAIAITGVLFLALVPFAAALQLVLMCGSTEIRDAYFCDETLRKYIFRVCVILQKLCLILLPVIFLGLNPTLRRKIWLTIRKRKLMENVVTISSNSGFAGSKDTAYESYLPNASDTGEHGDEDFITIAEDLTFGKAGDTEGKIKRRFSNVAVRHRQSVIDMVDVLSVISERSEITVNDK